MTGEAESQAWPAGRELYRDLKERLTALLDEQVVVERCASCPEFRAEGPFKEVRETFRTHVKMMHPERLAALDARPVRRAVPMTREPDYLVLRRLAEIAGMAA